MPEDDITLELEAKRAKSREATRRWRAKNPPIRTEATREADRAQKRRYREANQDALRARRRERYAANRAEAIESTGRYNREKRAAELLALGNPTDCEICGETIPAGSDGRDGRCIDHRHDNGLVRGVVCTSCNRALSVIDLQFEDPARWHRLLEFSGRHAPEVPTPATSERARRSGRRLFREG